MELIFVSHNLTFNKTIILNKKKSVNPILHNSYINKRNIMFSNDHVKCLHQIKKKKNGISHLMKKFQ